MLTKQNANNTLCHKLSQMTGALICAALSALQCWRGAWARCALGKNGITKPQPHTSLLLMFPSTHLP